MLLHVFHFAMVARGEPTHQMLSIFGDLDTGNTQSAEAERARAIDQRLLCGVEVKNFKLLMAKPPLSV